MPKAKPPALSRRERQIMDVLYKQERATAAEILEGLADQPNYSTVRAQLRVLEEKGHITHQEQGLRYVYSPTLPRDSARRSALRHLVETFFDGSTEQVVTALVGGEVSRLTPEELERLSQLLAKAKANNRQKKEDPQ
jgi:BlaI family penicillinase repressor